jgi:hypothetical protein
MSAATKTMGCAHARATTAERRARTPMSLSSAGDSDRSCSGATGSVITCPFILCRGSRASARPTGFSGASHLLDDACDGREVEAMHVPPERNALLHQLGTRLNSSPHFTPWRERTPNCTGAMYRRARDGNKSPPGLSLWRRDADRPNRTPFAPRGRTIYRARVARRAALPRTEGSVCAGRVRAVTPCPGSCGPQP